MEPADDRTPARVDLAWLGGLVAILLGILLWPYLRHAYRFGVGPDMPVYLWWTRVGAAEGLSLVGERPGAPALLATLAGALHLPVVAVAAGLQTALGAAVGAGGAALVRGRTRDVPRRLAWVAAGGLAGLFVVHLGAGYLANLVFLLAFLAAGAVLAAGATPEHRRAAVPAVAGAILLAGGGLAHPQFFLVGAAILLAVAAWQRSAEGRGDPVARQATIAVAGGAAGVLTGVASMVLGPARLDVDTSKDAFLRRAGLTRSLRSAYLDRFVHRWTRYVQVVAIPLAIPGASRTAGFTARFLIGWGLAMLAGVPIGLATGWYPADRLITFAFPVPILAGVGLAWVWRRLEPRRVLAAVTVGLLAAAMAGGALIAWGRQAPFLTPPEVAAVTEAGRIADTVPPGTPLVFVVDDADATATFLATRAGNVIRAALPPDRATDVHVFVGTPEDLRAGRPTVRGNPEYDALSRRSLEAIPTDGREPLILVVGPFDRTGAAEGDAELSVWSPGVAASIGGSLDAVPAARQPLTPSSPAGIAVAAVAALALVWAVGSGWSGWALRDRVAAVAFAPALGVATLVLAAVAFERLGLPLTGSVGPTVVVLVAGVGGYLVRMIGERRAGA